MRAGRVIALIAGVLLLLPGFGMLVGGGGLSLAYALERDDDGYFDVTIDRLQSSTVAVTAGNLEFSADPGSPDWLLDALDADVRLRVTSADSGEDVFVGIGPAADVEAYLAGVAYDEVIELDGLEPVYRNRDGTTDVGPPPDETFWAATTTGPGTQELTWEATGGRWTAVVMNADGSPGVAADVSVGARAGFVLPLALILLGLGALLTIAGVVLIIVGARGTRGEHRPDDADGYQTDPVGEELPPPSRGSETVPAHPVQLEAHLDPDLSRWMWLVKWFLAIPHFVVLAFLWVAFVVLTIVAGVAILFAGRYPRGIFDFNVGVMRWTWRVSYYATTGGVGTDRYPPFSLGPEPGDLARLDVAYPERLSHGLVIVKWLLAIPHLIIVAIVAGGSVRWLAADGDRLRFDPTGGGGLLGLLVLAAAIMLLFTDRYPRALFDLIVGFNRWIYRVFAYVALMTDDYPPFRLDQGGTEPTPPAPTKPPEPLPAPSAPDRPTTPDYEKVTR